MGIVFPAEGDLAIGEVDDPVVGDGHAMRVAGQIVEDVFGSSERRLGIDDPVVGEQRPDEGAWNTFSCGQRFQRAGQAELPAADKRASDRR